MHFLSINFIILFILLLDHNNDYLSDIYAQLMHILGYSYE